MYQQVELQDGTYCKMVNLPEHKLLKVGNSLTLAEEPERWWNIVWVSQTKVDKSKLDRKWNNNI